MGVSQKLSISQISQNVETNSSEIRIKWTSTQSGGSFNNILNTAYYSVTVNGSGKSYSANYKLTADTTVTIVDTILTVYHDSEGKCTVEVDTWMDTGTSAGEIEKYTSLTLDQIPRGSSFSLGNARTLGSEIVFNISRQGDFTETITYKCGSDSGTVVTKTSEAAVSWTPPITLAAQNTKGKIVSVTFILTTYSGNSAIATYSKTYDLTIPDSVQPSVSVEITDTSGCFAKYGAYVQSKSTLKVKITAAGIYGSAISSRQFTLDEKTYLGAENTAEAIKGTGSLPIVVSVKDSRGITATETINISVLAYNSPTVTSLVAQRCNADGTRNASGGYLAVVFDAAVTALNDKNSAAYTLKYKKGADSGYTSVELTDISGQYAVTGYQYIFDASKNSSYNVVISIKDDFPAIEKSAVGPSEMTLWSKFKNGMGFAIGKVAERLGYLDMGFHIHMNGNRLHGLPDPTDADDAVTKSYVDDIKSSIESRLFPVGYIYMSVDKTSPAELFGGSWTQLEDRFLLGAGTTYAAGDTGGEETHTLTIDEMPRHDHWGVYRPDWYLHDESGQASGKSDGSTDNQLFTDERGGGGAHNNMPPYLVVYMWKRIS